MARAAATAEIVELPEADRLEGFAHPRQTKDLFGQAAAEQTLAEAFASGRMHHGWLITGPAGVGKATLAYRFAKHALAHPEDRDPFQQSLAVPETSSAVRQVMALAHPGLLVMRRLYDTKTKRFTSTIPVDEVRRLRSFLALSADLNAWRVVIVDTADDMNASAANALLKSLEEPPQRTVCLILSSEPGRLLPTIRSRCRTLELAALAGEDLRNAVTRARQNGDDDHAVDIKDWDRLEALAGGSVRRALSLDALGGLDLDTRIERLIGKAPKIDWSSVHQLADGIASPAAEEKFELFYELFLARLARLVRAEAGGKGTASDIALARQIIGGPRLATFAHLWETVASEKARAMQLNLDRKALILDTFARLEAAARS